MRLGIMRIQLNRWGLVAISINILILVLALLVPNLLGDGLSPGDIGYTRFTSLVRSINFPVFALFQSGRLDPSTEVQKAWSPTQLLGYNASMLFLLVLCFALYWYCEGLVAHLLIRIARTLLRR